MDMSLMAQALCLAIIRASATVRAPSSMRNALSWPGFAPCSAASPASRAVCGVSALPSKRLLGGAGPPGPRGEAADGDACSTHGVALHVQRHSRRCERKGIRFPVADLVIGRGAAHRGLGHANTQDQLAGLERGLDVGRRSRLAVELLHRGWCAAPSGRAHRSWRRRRQERSPDRPDRRRCRHRCRPSSAWPRSMPLLGRATATGLALVAGERLAAAEVGTACALQEVAAERRHVAELLRGRPPERLRERRILGHDLRMRPPHRSSARERRRPAQLRSSIDAVQLLEAVTSTTCRRRLDVQLHQIVERRAAGQKARRRRRRRPRRARPRPQSLLCV